MINKITPKGRFTLIHRDIDGTILNQRDINNDVTNEGKNALLDIMFHADTQVTTWYLGLIDNSGFSALAAGDTHASHAGWTENTDYDEAARPAWTEGAASSQSITNSSAVDFTINDTVAIYGIFLASLSTKGSTAAGVLWSTAAADAVINLVSGQTLSVIYTIDVT